MSSIMRTWRVSYSLLALLTLVMSVEARRRTCPDRTINTAATASTTPSTSATPTTSASGQLFYWLSFSKTIKPGEPLAVMVYTPNATLERFTLGLNLVDTMGNELQQAQNFSLRARENIQTVYLEVSKKVKETDLFLRAQGWGFLQFVGFDRVHQESKSVSVFVQTDRLFYTPGQKVQFRTVSVFPNWRITYKLVDVEIRDPFNNLIAQWKQAKGQKRSGVFQGQIVTSYFPPLGDWKIIATVDGVSVEKTFEMRRYATVQPQFDVRLLLPSYTFSDFETVAGKVVAKYIFGSPVSGTGVVSASSGQSKIIFEFKLDENGEAVIKFPTADLLPLSSSSSSQPQHRIVDLSATVQNDVTHDSMTAKASLRIFDKPMALAFVPGTPSVFKPDLPITVSVQMLEPDGKRPLTNEFDLDMEFTATFYGNGGSEAMRMEQTVPVDSNGVAQFQTVPVSRDVTTVSITASAWQGTVTVSESFHPFTSPTNAFLRIQVKAASPTLNQDVKIEAVSNVEFRNLTYQVFSRNGMVLSEAVRSTRPKNRTDIKFQLTSDMAPIADVVMFIVTEQGEVVNDRLAIPVDPALLTLEFPPNLRKPLKNQVPLIVSAAKESTVFLLGVDERLRSMGTGNDITWNDVASDMAKYGDPMKYTSTTAAGVFNAADVGFITNAKVPGRDPSSVPPNERQTTAAASEPKTAGGTPLATTVTSSDSESTRQLNERALRRETPGDELKKIMLDTWLWEPILMNKKRRKIQMKPPYMLSTWEVTAFAVDPTHGLYMSRTPAKLVTSDMFVSTVEVPYSLVLGEEMCFTASTVNIDRRTVKMSMILKRNRTGFENIQYVEDPHNSTAAKEIRSNKKITADLGRVQPNGVASTVYCVKPLILGDTKAFLATKPAGKSQRKMNRYFKIKPEGLERTQTYGVLIEIPAGKGETFEYSVQVKLPDDFVDGSVKMSVSVGDVMGDAMERLNDPMTKPYGTAEEALLKFVANVNVLEYLKKTNRTTEDLVAKASANLLRGYQSLLRYQHKDGSFSSFGPRSQNDTGNLWLTADVTRSISYYDAMKLNETEHLFRSIDWIVKKQNSDGSFQESQKVVSRQGGSSGGTALAAHVTIALKKIWIQSSDRLPADLKGHVNATLRKAVTYLEGQLPDVKDGFTLCILAYALAVTDSVKAAEAEDEIFSFGYRLDSKTTPYPWHRKNDAMNIELSSYALMTFLDAGDLYGALEVYWWLIQRQGPDDNFISTQDTMPAREALSAMAGVLDAGDESSPIDVTINWESKTSSLTIDAESALQRQKRTIEIEDNKYPREVHIVATSSAAVMRYAVAQVTVRYNVKGDVASGTIDAEATVKALSPRIYELKTCVRRQADPSSSSSSSSSLVVAEIGMASGYELTSDVSSARRVIVSEDKVVLFYDTFHSGEKCSILILEMTKGFAIAKLKPTPVRVYDYANPDDEFTTSYTLPQRQICEVDPAICQMKS